MEAAPDDRRTRGLWLLVALVLLGIAPFFVSALLARKSRQKALADPEARKLLRDHEPPPISTMEPRTRKR